METMRVFEFRGVGPITGVVFDGDGAVAVRQPDVTVLEAVRAAFRMLFGDRDIDLIDGELACAFAGFHNGVVTVF